MITIEETISITIENNGCNFNGIFDNYFCKSLNFEPSKYTEG